MSPGTQEYGKLGTVFLFEISALIKPESIYGCFLIQPSFSIDHETEDYHLIAWGDPILRGGLPARFKGDEAAKYITENISGHFYYLLLMRGSGAVITGNSAFGILPVYYCERGSGLVLSDNALTLGKHVNAVKVSARFMLETVLFKYPLFDSSLPDGIKLLAANSHLVFSRGKLSVRRHLAIEDLFGSDPLPWKMAAGKTADAFIESVSAYLPDVRYASALTGGFDSRTLAAAGIGLGREMTAFSFGTEESEDVRISSRVASVAGIPFRKILLGNDYIKNESYRCGRDFIRNASGTATFARAHYLFSARQLAGDYRYMVTGNFGSEIFRSPHFAGSLISPNAVALFTAGTVEKAVEQIEKSAEYRCLDTGNLGDTWNSLKSDLHRLPCFNPGYADLTRNQQLYIFVFEEVFRKYFGAEMVNQFGHIKNRTPFLDLSFLKAIFASRLAGVHSDFFEHNPLKRYKGQVLYAHIIRKAFPPLGKILTDKGYRPDDLLSFGGRFSIVANYARKKLRRQQAEIDPYAVRESWDYNRITWMGVKVPEQFFRLSREGKIPGMADRELISRILSLSAAAGELPGQ